MEANQTIAEAWQYFLSLTPHGEVSVKFIIEDEMYEAESSYEPVYDTDGRITENYMMKLKVKRI